NLAIEFIEGEVQVHDNPVGVMTNRPDFGWQINNLRNYINLDAHDKKDRVLNGLKIEPTGVGSGMLGLPGDWTPPSRFVRLAYSLDAALPAKNAKEAVNLAEHLLNSVDIPKGAIKENPAPFITLEGNAEWVVIKDLTNLDLYYKTYNNTSWKKVDLKNFKLAPGAPRRSIAIIDYGQQTIDVSSELK
ncbi:MAG: linear amide C-N hydrolase, partial [Candidatus Omnitrophica bacterium]|nr:linear amide C-N hydrolase [Candidatus Omnitrophota bacterium]